MRLTLILAVGALFVATSPVLASTRLVSPDAVTQADQPRVIVEKQDGRGVDLVLELPALATEAIEFDGQEYQSLAIPGGSLEGNVGQPAIPTFNRFVAIPAESGVTITTSPEDEEVLTGMRLAPMPSDEGEPFAIDTAAYSRDGFDPTPAASVGAPAICGALRLVPVTMRPVRYNPAQGIVRVSHRIRIAVRYEGSDPRNRRPVRSDFIPESFDRMYRNLVMNYDGPPDGVRTGTGTYLLICPSTGGVQDSLQALVAWHTRKGIHVQVATTAQTGTTNNQIKSYIQSVYNSANPPLEYVGLVGDASGTYTIPTWTENLSGYGGEGDHPYSELAGGDPLSDVHLGRLSASSANDLSTILHKSILYESAPNLSDAGWFTRAALVGDPTTPSGPSPRLVMQWIKTRLRQIGYTQVDTVFGGDFVSQMSTALNRGSTIFAYRGYWGFSGWQNSNTAALTNTNKLHFACISTCGTGIWAGQTSNSEQFLRTGSYAAPRAGIGAIGTATTGTHTRFNNCLTYGVFYGLLYEDLWSQGAALTRGKLELYLNYWNSSQSEYVTIFSYWNTLMGDPAVNLWTAFPSTFGVTHPANVAVGTNSVSVTATWGGFPVADATVCLWKGSETYVKGTTNAQGQCELAVSLPTAGTMKLTVTKHNFLPYLADIPVTTQTLFVGYQASAVDDDNTGESHGNSDGLASPLETIELRVQLRNFGSQSASNVSATLTSDDPYVTITDATESFGTIGAGAVVWSGDDFDFTIGPGCPHGHVLRFGLNVTSGANQWHSLIDLPTSSAKLTASSVTWYNAGNGQLDPGENLELSIRLRNEGTVSAITPTAVLTTESPWLTVGDANGSYATLAPGTNGENTTDRFRISAASDAYQGHLATLRLVATYSGGVVDTAFVNVTVGTGSSDDPIGPDRYGYFAFDNTDTSYPEAPIYSWVEIDPNQLGPGAQVPLGDFGNDQDRSTAMNLPFSFQYYGEPYSRVTICSNGWIAMGDTYLTDYRNWTIPGAGAPQNLIAVFWDDLYEVNNPAGHVYQWYDAANHRFIVEWSRMRNLVGGSTETCQVILYDPAHYPTSSGDGIILMQYQTVNNVDGTDGFATVGIQNRMQNDGILYSYFDTYPAGAAVLTNGRAIRFLPATAQPQGTLTGTVRNASLGNAPLSEAVVQLMGTTRTYTSGPDGTYGGNAPEGTYDMVCTRVGFRPDTVRNVTITPSQTTVVNFTLTDEAGPTISNVTQLVSTTDTQGPYVIEATIADGSGIGAATLQFRVGGGGWVPLPMTLNGDVYRGEIPGLPSGSEVDYYVSAQDPVGFGSVDPPGAPVQFYTFRVTEIVYATTVEDPGDPGWQLGVAGDNATLGLWIRDDPVGTSYNGDQIQPEFDHTAAPGVKCFVTGNGTPGGAPGEQDVDGGCTTLQSPSFDLSTSQTAIVRYWRWYGEGGLSLDDDFVVQVSSNGGSSWTELERVPDIANSWTLVTIDLGTLITLTNQVVFRFVACDLNSGGLVEAAIDDFSLEAFRPNAEDVGDGAGGPAVFRLERSHPNPFSGRTEIAFSLEQTGPARLYLYDVQGRTVRRLVNGSLEAGPHVASWDGRDDLGRLLPSGIYFYRLDAGRRSETHKLMRLE